MGADDPARWGEFGVALVGASAALAGLTFVAISINLGRILAGTGLTGRAAEGVITLMLGLVTCALLLVPDQGARAVGIEWLALGAAYAALLVRNHLQAARAHTVGGRVLGTRVALHQSAAILWIVAGLAAAVGVGGGLYWVVPAALWTVVVGTSDAWVLMIEILR